MRLEELSFGEKKSIQLEQFRFAAQYRINEQLLANNLHGGKHSVQLLKHLTDNYVLDIKSKFVGKPFDYLLPTTFPLTWWDHFKRDAIPTFSRWLKLKIRFKQLTIKSAVIFPDVPELPGDRYYYMETNFNTYTHVGEVQNKS